MSVTNTGSRPAATTCRLSDPADAGLGATRRSFLTPRIDAGRDGHLHREVTELGRRRGRSPSSAATRDAPAA